MIAVSLEALKSVEKSRPAGYVADVLSKGKLDGESVLLENHIYFELRHKYSGEPVPKVSVQQKARNIAAATSRLVKAVTRGQQVKVDEMEQDRRMSICKTCQFFTGQTCLKCGCVIRFKSKLATEHCPINKW